MIDKMISLRSILSHFLGEIIIVIPLAIYDIYYLIKMKKVEKYFERNI